MAYEQGDEITLRGMTFHTLIGVLPHEREHAQPLEIDVTVWMEEDQRILDYRRLYASVRTVVESPNLLYLEELAESIASRVLHEPSVRRARVAIRKPHVAIGGPLRDVEVAIVRPRDA
ncbi:MAG: dihydroneopterin aldolase [Gemmatimonadaceae bacterium]